MPSTLLSYLISEYSTCTVNNNRADVVIEIESGDTVNELCNRTAVSMHTTIQKHKYVQISKEIYCNDKYTRFYEIQSELVK